MAKKKTDISGVSKNLAKSIAEDIRKESNPSDLPLKDVRVGISVSESEEYKELGFSAIHQRDITTELTRYILANGAHLVYGGDLRSQGYTVAFTELAFQYRRKQEHDVKHYTNYFGWPTHLLLKNSDEATFKRNRVNVVKVEVPEAVPEALRNTMIDADTPENKYYWAKSMSKMRASMTQDCQARVFIGGKLTNYRGFCPGIIEEAYLTLQNRQPLYLIGAFGGATRVLIRAIQGENGSSLSSELATSNPEMEQLYGYCEKVSDPVTRVAEMLEHFKKLGTAGLSTLNGLTETENERLFDTQHLHEMVYYVLVGLKKALSKV